MKTSIVATVFVIAATLFAVHSISNSSEGSPRAEGHFSIWAYSLFQCGWPFDEADHADPVGIVFYGNSHNGSMNHVAFHTGWTFTSGSPQSFWSHDYCWLDDWQRANGCGECTRFHIRGWNMHAEGDWYHYDQNWGYTGVGTPHYELWNGCHRVQANTTDNDGGFNKARRKVTNSMNDTHIVQTVDWGNSEHQVQCGGTTAWSNGNVRWIEIPAWNH